MPLGKTCRPPTYPSERPVRRGVPVEPCCGSSVVGGEGDDCILQHAALLQGGHDAPHGLVQLPQHGRKCATLLVLDVGELLDDIFGSLKEYMC